MLPCAHGFHAPCIAPWAEETNKCPVCRQPINREQPTRLLASDTTNDYELAVRIGGLHAPLFNEDDDVDDEDDEENKEIDYPEDQPEDEDEYDEDEPVIENNVLPPEPCWSDVASMQQCTACYRIFKDFSGTQSCIDCRLICCDGKCLERHREEHSRSSKKARTE